MQSETGPVNRRRGKSRGMRGCAQRAPGAVFSEPQAQAEVTQNGGSVRLAQSDVPRRPAASRTARDGGVPRPRGMATPVGGAPRGPGRDGAVRQMGNGNSGTVNRRINSRAKGAAGEREFAAVLRAAGWPTARRGQQRSGLDQADVIDGPREVHWEVKRVEALSVWAAAAQAARDAGPGEVPVVAMRRNGGDWLAVVPLTFLLQVLALRDALG